MIGPAGEMVGQLDHVFRGLLGDAAQRDAGLLRFDDAGRLAADEQQVVARSFGSTNSRTATPSPALRLKSALFCMSHPAPVSSGSIFSRARCSGVKGTCRILELFTNGRSQAVRLPKSYRFEGDEVLIKRVGKAVVLLPRAHAWDTLFDGLEQFEPGTRIERAQPRAQQKRAKLKG
jgi:antitoxin VapB